MGGLFRKHVHCCPAGPVQPALWQESFPQEDYENEEHQGKCQLCHCARSACFREWNIWETLREKVILLKNFPVGWLQGQLCPIARTEEKLSMQSFPTPVGTTWLQKLMSWGSHCLLLFFYHLLYFCNEWYQIYSSVLIISREVTVGEVS